MGVSKHRGTAKWMVKIMENPIKMDDLGGTTIFGNTHIHPPKTPSNYLAFLKPNAMAVWKMIF